MRRTYCGVTSAAAAASVGGWVGGRGVGGGGWVDEVFFVHAHVAFVGGEEGGGDGGAAVAGAWGGVGGWGWVERLEARG